jgi:hypothetical protein
MVPQHRCDPEPKCCARRPIAADPQCNPTAADVRSREKPPLLNFVAGFVAVAGRESRSVGAHRHCEAMAPKLNRHRAFDLWWSMVPRVTPRHMSKARAIRPDKVRADSDDAYEL